jgi:hypothetical protein
MTELESSTAKLRGEIARLSIREPEVTETEALTATLIGDLAQRVDLL